MKILCILYDDPKDGMPSSYPVKELPKLEKYPDGMTLPSPKGRDFTPGQLLGCVSGELGLRKFLERRNVLKNQKGRRFYLVVVTHLFFCNYTHLTLNTKNIKVPYK